MTDSNKPTARAKDDNAISIVLADDHPVVLEGLVNLLSYQPDMNIMSSCSNGEEALVAARKHQPDVMVLDLLMPVMTGLEVMEALQDMSEPPKVALLTAELDSDTVLKALEYGVRGILLKEMAPRMIVQCIRKIHDGGEWIERDTVGDALKNLLQRNTHKERLQKKLTSREFEIAVQVAGGLRNAQIAEQLSVTEGTVKTHLHNIYEKLNIKSRLALAKYLLNNNIK